MASRFAVTNLPASDGTIHDHSTPDSHRQAVDIDPATLIFVIGLTTFFLFLLFRNTGLHPSIFGDEWSYSFFSRLADSSASPTPNYIYFLLFGWTRVCGHGFLECARILNSLLFVTASLFIYWTTQQLTGKPTAAFVALMSLAAPINIYTAYFMPESMYFLVFWALTWFAITYRGSRPAYYGSILGCLCAMMTMIKPNALFLFPGIIIFILYYYIVGSRNGKAGVIAISYLLIVAGIVRFGTGYVLAGPAGLHLLGTKYAPMAEAAITLEQVRRLTGLSLNILKGHLMGVMLLFGMPIASLVTMQIRNRRDAGPETTLHVIQIYLVAVTIPLLVMTCYFSAIVVGTSPYESAARLGMRYYNFGFPLFLMVAAGQLSFRGARRSGYAVTLAVAALVGVYIYSLKALLRDYSPNAIDSPELHGLTAHSAVFYVLAIPGVVSVMLWALNRKLASQLFLFIFTPACLLSSTVIVNAELRQRIVPDVYNQAGMFAHEVLSQHDRSKLVVGGSEIAGLLSVLFYVDDPGARMLFIPKGAPFDQSEIQSDREWLLLMGDHQVPADLKTQIAEDGYRLFRLPNRSASGKPELAELSFGFSRPFEFGVVSDVSGLSVPEEFGRWSDEAEVKVKLVSPLPRAFNLRLSANAFGPNAELPFTIRVGRETRVFRLSELPTDVYFSFTTDGAEKEIIISVPKPTSPKQLGMSNDDRRLGIAVRQMTITSTRK
jgi:phosphoglycerol transferase